MPAQLKPFLQKLVIWRNKLRWLVLPYFFILIMKAFMVLMVVGYGLAHASEDAVGQFFMYMLVIGAALFLPALALLFNSTKPFVVVLQAIGVVVVMLPVLVVFLFAGYGMLIKPQITKYHFLNITSGITASIVKEAPILHDGVQVGLQVQMAVNLPRNMPVAFPTKAVLDALNGGMYVAETPRKNNGLLLLDATFSPLYTNATTTRDGKPIDTLPVVQAVIKAGYGSDNNLDGDLPKGTYFVTRHFLFNGLSTHAYSGTDFGRLCKAKPFTAISNTASSNAPVSFIASMSERISINGPSRRGPYIFVSWSAPLRYQHHQQAWKSTMDALDLPMCEALQAELDDKAAKAQAVTREQQYSTNSAQLDWHDNPLYKEACAGDTEKIKARIARDKAASPNPDAPWLPPVAVSGILHECAINTPREAVFRLLIPGLAQSYAVGQESDGYCAVLSELHRKRNMGLLSAMVEQGLPLDCAGKAVWIAGLSEDGPSSPLLGADINDPTALPWLKLLIKAEVDICAKPEHAFKTAFNFIAPYASPEILELFVDAGCNANYIPEAPEHEKYGAAYVQQMSPAMQWFIRRWFPLENANQYYQIDVSNPSLIAKLDKKMAVSIQELNGPSQDGKSYWLKSYVFFFDGSEEYRNTIKAKLKQAGANQEIVDAVGGRH